MAHIAGYAGSLYSCVQLLGGACFSFAISHLNTNSPQPMAVMYLLSGISGLLIFLTLCCD